MNKYYSYTSYPKVFSETYWGNFNSPPPEKDIVLNRDAFAKEYSLAEYIDSDSPSCNHGFFDHPELYKSGTHYIYIISPYGEENILNNTADRYGMIKYRNLYNKKTITYLKIFENKKEFNRWKAFCGKLK